MKFTDTERLDAFIEHNKYFRYSSHPTMCGRYPCWICWIPSKGTTEYKNVREALDDLLTDLHEYDTKTKA